MGVNHLLNVSFGADITSELHPSKSLSGWDFPDVPDGCQLYRTLYAGAAWKADTGAESYNVTFDHLMSYVREHGIFGPACREELECGLGGGAVYPILFREDLGKIFTGFWGRMLLSVSVTEKSVCTDTWRKTRTG